MHRCCHVILDRIQPSTPRTAAKLGRTGPGPEPGRGSTGGGRGARPHRPGDFEPRSPAVGAMAGRQRYRLLLENAEQLVLVCGRREPCLRRDGAAGLAVLRAASLVVGL